LGFQERYREPSVESKRNGEDRESYDEHKVEEQVTCPRTTNKAHVLYFKANITNVRPFSTAISRLYNISTRQQASSSTWPSSYSNDHYPEPKRST
jgi:hypothetical protein